MTRTNHRTLTAEDIMRTFIGGHSVVDQLYNLRSTGGNFPPYNVREVGAASDGSAEFLIELAVAGFEEDEILIKEIDGRLVVHSEKQDDTDTDNYLYRGIALRNFYQEWVLSDHVHVESAKMKNGMLEIRLMKEVPEEKKPRAIHINK
jgi:molecular chaperone IbpA